MQRAKLISDLQQYQVDDSNYDRMPSTSVVQTAGRKRFVRSLDSYLNIKFHIFQQNIRFTQFVQFFQ